MNKVNDRFHLFLFPYPCKLHLGIFLVRIPPPNRRNTNEYPSIVLNAFVPLLFDTIERVLQNYRQLFPYKNQANRFLLI